MSELNRIVGHSVDGWTVGEFVGSERNTTHLVSEAKAETTYNFFKIKVFATDKQKFVLNR